MKRNSRKQTTLDKVVENFKLGQKYAQDGYHERWDRNWKASIGVRTMADYVGVSNHFITETHTIIESIKANIMGGRQKFEYAPMRYDQETDTRVLNSLVESYWYRENFPLEVTKTIDDMLKLGTGFLWAFWDEEKQCFTPKYVPLRDNFIDPTASDYYSERYAGFRYLTTIEELEKEQILNPDTGEYEPRYNIPKNVDPVMRGTKEEFDKELKDMFYGSTLGQEAKDKQVEIIYYVDKEKLVQVLNRSHVIEEMETPFKREAQVIESFDDEGNPIPVEIPEIPAFIPRAPFRDYIDGSLYYGKSEIDVILETQEKLNDVGNQKADNLSYMTNRSYVLDPAFSDKIEELDSVPGAIFTVPPGAIDMLPVQPLGVDADNEMFRLKDEMRRATAADELIQGAGQDKGMLTATEVRAQMASSGGRFQLKLSLLENEAFKILADILFKLIQINITQEIAVRVIGPEGVEFKNYNPGEYLGDYEPRVMLDATAAAVKEEEKQNAMQFFQMSVQMPFVNQVELYKRTAKSIFNVEDAELESLVQEPMMDPAMMGMEPGMEQGMDPGMDIQPVAPPQAEY